MDLHKIEAIYQEVSYHKKPDKLSVEEWQYALRRQFALKQKFSVTNIGRDMVFSDFMVNNPETGNSYKVAIRSYDNSTNFCSCPDFKTNQLGTCKHIEAVLLMIKKRPELEEKLKDGYQPSYTSVYVHYYGQRTVKIRIGSEKYDEFKSWAKKYFEGNTLKPSAYYEFEKLIEEASAIHPGFRCYPDALDLIIETREKKERIQKLEQKYLADANSNVFDELVKINLFPYQKDGVRFASAAGRAILADDMGLGKTLQAIASAELMKKEFGIDSVLIVCPTSLKYQWKSEIEKFTSSSCRVIEGNALAREQQYQGSEFYKILSYNALNNDVAVINELETDLVILDEAQRIKNYKTKISQNVKRLKSRFAFVLTGTPLENKLEELYSVVQFVDPFGLGPFYRFLSEHQIKNETGKVVGYKNLNEIGHALSEIMIRRTKAQVLKQLPERLDKVLFVPMTERQNDIHEENQAGVSRLINKWKRFGFLNEKDRQRLMIMLNLMRMACDSTFVIDQLSRHDTKIEELMGIVDEVLSQGDEKIVVFSQWERMTRLVAMELDTRGVGYEYLHGGIPSSDREKLFVNFNNDPKCRVFLSTDAGGVGLNLQAASYLVNLDIPWNPAVLEQRIARIYRLGQKRNVIIFNMVSVNTIEHRMLDVLTFKSSLSRGILDGGEDAIFMGQSRFTQFMGEIEKMVVPSKEKVVAESDLDADSETKDGKISETVSPEIAIQGSLFDDEPINKPESALLPSQEKTVPETQPQELMQLGFQFFGQLAQTLADKDATKKLVDSLVAKDETDGRTYLKIPVENSQVVENVFGMLAGFLGAMKK